MNAAVAPPPQRRGPFAARTEHAVLTGTARSRRPFLLAVEGEWQVEIGGPVRKSGQCASSVRDCSTQPTVGLGESFRM